MAKTLTTAPLAPQISFGLPRFARRLFDYMGLHAQRRALAHLDEAALSDIGVSRAAAEAEAARPFWDVPATWRN